MKEQIQALIQEMDLEIETISQLLSNNEQQPENEKYRAVIRFIKSHKNSLLHIIDL